MDSVAVLLVAWLGSGACAFTAGAVTVSRVRRRLHRVEQAQIVVPVEQDELAHAA